MASQKYWPYGAVRAGGVTQTDKLYTGQQVEPGDAALGLYNYKARFYSTLTGRFVSADTSTADGLNRYAYVRDNPIRYSDPSGHGVTNDDGTSCPATRPDCLNDGGPGPVGGTGPGCNDLCHCAANLAACQALADADYCAHHPADCQTDPACSGPAGCPAPPWIVPPGQAPPEIPLVVAVGAACTLSTDGLCSPLAGAAIGLAYACLFLCEPAAHAASSAASDLYDWAKGKARSKPGSLGQPKGTDALRRENRRCERRRKLPG